MTASVYKQALDNVVDVIKGLNLDGVADNEVVLRKFPWDDTHPPLKGVTVSWDKEREAPGTTCRDDIGYPCFVTMVQGSDKGWTNHIDRITQWRESVRRAFHNQRLLNVSSTGTNHLICKVLHSAIELPDKYRNNFDVSQLLVMCWFRESRSDTRFE